MANLRVPVLIVFGERETTVLGAAGGTPKTDTMVRQYESAAAPKLLVGVADARHVEFGGAGKASLRPAAAGPPSADKVRATDPVIRATNAYLLPFFRRYLRDDPAAEKQLAARAEGLFLFRCDLAPATRPAP